MIFFLQIYTGVWVLASAAILLLHSYVSRDEIVNEEIIKDPRRRALIKLLVMIPVICYVVSWMV